MKKLLWLVAILALVSIGVFAADLAQPTAGGMILNDFEEYSGAIDKQGVDNPAQGPFAWWVYFDPSGKGIRAEAVNDAAHGAKALQLSWDVSGWGGGSGFKPADPKIVWDWSNYKGLSFWVKVNNPDSRFLIELDDVNKEVFWSAPIKARKPEWTQVIIPIKQIRARGDWQPADAKKNLAIDWPVQIQIVTQSPKGDVSLDFFEAVPNEK